MLQSDDAYQIFLYRDVSFPQKKSPVIFILPQSRHLQKAILNHNTPRLLRSVSDTYLTPVSNKWLEGHDLHVNSKHMEEW